MATKTTDGFLAELLPGRLIKLEGQEASVALAAIGELLRYPTAEMTRKDGGPEHVMALKRIYKKLLAGKNLYGITYRATASGHYLDQHHEAVLTPEQAEKTKKGILALEEQDVIVRGYGWDVSASECIGLFDLRRMCLNYAGTRAELTDDNLR